jgi:hypothetical protein
MLQSGTNRKRYDIKTLQKKMKKLKKLIKATDNEDQLEGYRQKQQEYEDAMDNIINEDMEDSFELADILVEMTDVERKRYSTYEKKFKKAEKLIAKARAEGDTDAVEKLQRKRDEYLSAMQELKKR